MSRTSPAPDATEQPHLVSLVLQSKKALQHGEQLCSRAHSRSNASAQAAVDVLALDAKVRWVGNAVEEQLKLAADVAKNIQEKRSYLAKQLQAWDSSRTKNTNALDAMLESLGAQLVPPEFHQSSSGSSLFGSHHSQQSDSDFRQTPIIKSANVQEPSPVSPSATLRYNHTNGSLSGDKGHRKRKDVKEDRKTWKTLRDFVDDQAIEDVLEAIENDRLSLDDILCKTDHYPETLNDTIASIRSSLPALEPTSSMISRIQETITAQDGIIASMARSLESLASHYGQMANALEAGEAFSEEDMQDMNRDTEELPLIMTELEDNTRVIEEHHGQLTSILDARESDINHLGSILDNLDELGEIMEEMLQTQDSVQVECEGELDSLQQHLLTLETLRERFVAYQTAFSKLILEISRRRQYCEAAENIVKGMTSQLKSMTEEEHHVRAHFNAEYGAHIPEDICLFIGNTPTKWEVVPWSIDTIEVLPEIDEDLIAEARDRIGMTEVPPGAESL